MIDLLILRGFSGTKVTLTPEESMLVLGVVLMILVFTFVYTFGFWQRSKLLKFPRVLPKEGFKVQVAFTYFVIKGGFPGNITFFEDKLESKPAFFKLKTLFYSKINNVDYRYQAFSITKRIVINDEISFRTGSNEASKEVLNFLKRKNISLSEDAKKFLSS